MELLYKILVYKLIPNRNLKSTDTVVKRLNCVWALFVSYLSVKILSDVMVKLNITLVCQIVEYNIVLWAPSYTYVLDNQKIRIQHKAIKIIPSDSHLPYHGIDRLRHLNLSSSRQH